MREKEMEKLELQSADVTAKNVDAIAALFPQVVTEGRDDEGNIVHRIDFEALRQELSDYVVDGAKEAYHIDWPGKLAAEFARRCAQASITRMTPTPPRTSSSKATIWRR